MLKSFEKTFYAQIEKLKSTTEIVVGEVEEAGEDEVDKETVDGGGAVEVEKTGGTVADKMVGWFNAIVVNGLIAAGVCITLNLPAGVSALIVLCAIGSSALFTRKNIEDYFEKKSSNQVFVLDV